MYSGRLNWSNVRRRDGVGVKTPSTFLWKRSTLTMFWYPSSSRSSASEYLSSSREKTTPRDWLNVVCGVHDTVVTSDTSERVRRAALSSGEEASTNTLPSLWCDTLGLRPVISIIFRVILNMLKSDTGWPLMVRRTRYFE